MHTKTMLLLLPMLAMSAYTDTPRVESRLYGEWIEVQPTHGSEIRGVRLLKGGRAESIGIHTLTLESWSVSSDRLILNGRYPEDGRSTRFSDTLDILLLTPERMILNNRNHCGISYVRPQTIGHDIRPASDSHKEPFSPGQVYTLCGTLEIGHEVRSFTPDGSDDAYWIVDRNGRLEECYDRLTGDSRKYDPIRGILRLEYDGHWEEGFAAEYAGTFLVREIIDLQSEDPSRSIFYRTEPGDPPSDSSPEIHLSGD